MLVVSLHYFNTNLNTIFSLSLSQQPHFQSPHFLNMYFILAFKFQLSLKYKTYLDQNVLLGSLKILSFPILFIIEYAIIVKLKVVNCKRHFNWLFTATISVHLISLAFDRKTNLEEIINSTHCPTY